MGSPTAWVRMVRASAPLTKVSALRSPHRPVETHTCPAVETPKGRRSAKVVARVSSWSWTWSVSAAPGAPTTANVAEKSTGWPVTPAGLATATRRLPPAESAFTTGWPSAPPLTPRKASTPGCQTRRRVADPREAPPLPVRSATIGTVTCAPCNSAIEPACGPTTTVCACARPARHTPAMARATLKLAFTLPLPRTGSVLVSGRPAQEDLPVHPQLRGQVRQRQRRRQLFHLQGEVRRVVGALHLAHPVIEDERGEAR